MSGDKVGSVTFKGNVDGSMTIHIPAGCSMSCRKCGNRMVSTGDGKCENSIDAARAEIVAKLRERFKQAKDESIAYGQCPDHHREWRLRADQIHRDMTWIEAGCP